MTDGIMRWIPASIDRANGATKGAEDEDIKPKGAVQTQGGKNWGAITALYLDPKRSTVREEEHDTLNNAPGLGQDRPFP
jgi:hypothetical protein